MRGIDDRLREADDLEFRVAKPGTTLPYEANLGVVTSTVQGPLYETLLAVLADGSRRISQIVADPRLEGTPPADLARAVDAGVALGLFEVSARAVAGPHDTHGSAAEIAGGRPCDITHRFNKAVIGADALGGRPVAVASEATGSGDALYDQAVAVVLRDRKVSTSYIQRRLQIGYNKAASLIERMEQEGLISSSNATGKREILGGGEAA
jgi:DNA segregation ATPase FtsK/SpoIIIE-like protein